jgi:NAD(P)H-flavin reductase
VVAVVGSALAVARPVMSLRIEAGGAPSTYLYLGVRAARDVPLIDEVAAWAEAGVTVVLCLSRAELEHDRGVLTHATRAEGYVQKELERAIDASRVPQGALIIAAGPEAMLEELRAFGALRKREIDVVTNT